MQLSSIIHDTSRLLSSAAMKNVSFKNSNLLYKKKPRNIENDVLQQDFRWDYRFLRIYSPCPLSFLLIQTHYCRWEDSIESCDAAKMKLFTFFLNAHNLSFLRLWEHFASAQLCEA